MIVAQLAPGVGGRITLALDDTPEKRYDQHLNQWLLTLVELTTWNTPATVLVDRRDRPWDNTSRRPSHADRRRHIAREMLRKQFPQLAPAAGESQKTPTVWKTRLQLCT